MPKKTTILIVVLLFFTAGLVYLAIRTEQQIPAQISEEVIDQGDLTDLVAGSTAKTQIAFSPIILNVAEDQRSSHTANITVNTNNQSVSDVQLELAYDPAVLTDVSIEPSENNLFGQNPAVLISSIDEQLGRISFTITAAGPDNKEVVGNANIAKITFSTIPNLTQSTQISIIPKTTVRSLRSTKSLLQNAIPLNIIFPSPSIAPTQTIFLPSPPEIESE